MVGVYLGLDEEGRPLRDMCSLSYSQLAGRKALLYCYSNLYLIKIDMQHILQ